MPSPLTPRGPTAHAESATVRAAIDALRAGGPALVVDDGSSGTGAALVAACQHATPSVVGRLTAAASGPIRLAVTPTRARELGLAAVAAANEGSPAHARTVGARDADGAPIERTMTTIIDPASGPEDLVEPGPLAPVAARSAGVLERAGHAEAALDLSRMAGLVPAAVFAETARAACGEVPAVTIAELIAHRLHAERTVQRRAAARLPAVWGDFTAIGYETTMDGRHHLAMVMGDLESDDGTPPLVRVHAERLLRDRFEGWSGEGDVARALRAIAAEGRGAFVYVARADRGLGPLAGDSAATPDVQLRDYGIGAQILVDLGLHRIRLLTDNPRRIVGLDGYGLELAGHEPLTAA